MKFLFGNTPHRQHLSYCWPDRKYVVEPIFDREAIIMAGLDLNAIDREKMTLDVSGHYSRGPSRRE